MGEQEVGKMSSGFTTGALLRPPPVRDEGGAAAIPRPGEVFDPVARALDRIGDRWTLVLVRHLLGAPRGFQELRVRTGIAPRVLSGRLRELVAADFVTTVSEGARSLYALTARGRTLEPIVAATARWWVQQAMGEAGATPREFTETSAQSILESLPFLLRDERARGVRLVFEIRLTGAGGGVWTVHIEDGTCSATPGFAERSDVRYTADARTWCMVALGMLDPREAVRTGALVKEGGAEALDHFFFQVGRPAQADTTPTNRSRRADPPTRKRRRSP
ncbi:MAG: transcriptional regulator [Deltaproteobacteria bacterium]|nr:transcriptional regulator [Deltaproteobacteria bacterium]